MDWTIIEQQDNAIDWEIIQEQNRLQNRTTQLTGQQNNNNRQYTYGVSATYANG